MRRRGLVKEVDTWWGTPRIRALDYATRYGEHKSMVQIVEDAKIIEAYLKENN